MFRLSLKDFRINKQIILLNLIFWTIFLPVWLEMSIDIYLLLFIFIPIIVIMLSINTETKNNTDVLYISLPIRRQAIVFARYISAIIYIIGIFAYVIVYALILDKFVLQFQSAFIDKISTSSLLTILFLAVIIIALLLPVIYKFGSLVGITIGIFISVIVVSGFIFGVEKIILINKHVFVELNSNNISLFIILKDKNLLYLLGQLINKFSSFLYIFILVFLMVIVIFISIKISVNIFNKKEF